MPNPIWTWEVVFLENDYCLWEDALGKLPMDSGKFPMESCQLKAAYMESCLLEDA